MKTLNPWKLIRNSATTTSSEVLEVSEYLNRSIVDLSFEDFFYSPEVQKKNFVCAIKKGFPISVISKINRLETGELEIIVSKEGKKMLRKGEWAFTSRKDGFQLTLRDKKKSFKEQPYLRSKGKKLQNVSKFLVNAAHVITNLDNQVQLASLYDNISSLKQYLEDDRKGELKGIYYNLQKCMLEDDKTKRNESLERISDRLTELENRFLTTSIGKFENIKDPNSIGFFHAAIKGGEEIESQLFEAVNSAYSDLNISMKCNQLNQYIQISLESPAKAELIERNKMKALEDSKTLIATKLEYIEVGNGNQYKAELEKILSTGDVILSVNE